MSRSRLVVGLDIGTTKVCAIVSEVDENGLKIIGMGSHPSRGLRKGVVNNIESTCASIEAAVADAEQESGVDIHSVFVGMTGWQVKSIMSHGVAALRKGEVGKVDFDRVMEAASAVVIPNDREVIHVLPCEYIVDDKVEKDPLGHKGVRFEVNCHVVTSESTSIDNIFECCRETGLYVEQIVFEPLAGAQSVLTKGEKEEGVAMIDIGGGTCDLVIVSGGAVIHSAVIPLGGVHITNDIAQVLKVPVTPTAEMLKLLHGVALQEMAGLGEIEVEIPGQRIVQFVKEDLLAQIIEKRVEEMLRLVEAEIANSGFEEGVRTGIVLTGGSSLLKGMDQLAQRVFQLPVRIGRPGNFANDFPQIDNPIYSTAVGLVLHGQKGGSKRSALSIKDRIGIDGVISRMKRWFGGLSAR